MDEYTAPCPSCGGKVEDYIWLYDMKYYCTLEHVPGRKKTRVTTRHADGSIDFRTTS